MLTKLSLPSDLPLWLNVFIITCWSISTFGIMLHYNLSQIQRRHLKVAVYRIAKRLQAVPIRILDTGAKAAMAAIDLACGLIPSSRLMSVFAVSFIWSVLVSIFAIYYYQPLGKAVHSTYRTFIMRNFPDLWSVRKDLDRALEEKVLGGGPAFAIVYKHYDLESRRIQRLFEDFEFKEPITIGHDPESVILGLYLLFGNPRIPALDPNVTDSSSCLKIAVIITLVATIDSLLTAASAFVCLDSLESIRKSDTLMRRTICLGNTFFASCLCLYLIVLHYKFMTLIGLHSLEGYFALFKLLLPLFLGAIAVSSTLEYLRKRSFIDVMYSMLGLVFIALLAYYVFKYRMDLMFLMRPPIPLHTNGIPIPYLFGLMAIVPGVITLACLIGAGLFHAIGWMFLNLLIFYLRFVVRAPVPVTITLLATPALVAESLAALWKAFK